MTNKDSIQQKHLEAIENEVYGSKGMIANTTDAATSCTTVTADAIDSYQKWVNLLFTINGDEYIVDDVWHDQSKLPELFLNQKAKI